MAKVSEMLPSRFLKKEDVPQPVLVTITDVTQESMDKDSDEKRWCAHFAEFEKPMVLNSTNIQMIALACGSDDSDDWLGRKIVLFCDPNVSFAGKIVGGLRLRAAKNQPKLAPKPTGRIAEMEEDPLDPPF